MQWTRRAILGALGASAVAPALAPFVQACGSSAPQQARTARRPGRSMAEIREQLRAVVTELSRRFEHASALARVCRTGSAMADTGERSLQREVATSLVLTVATGERSFEQASADLSLDGIVQAAAALSARAASLRQVQRRIRPLGPARSHVQTLAVDPEQAADSAWIERVEQLYDRGRRVGGSRVVYRSAYLLADDSETVFVGNGQDLAQRVVRTRAGVVLLAEVAGRRSARRELGGAGSVRVDEASQGGTMGLEATELPDAELEAAAERVLALVTPAEPPAGDMDLVLAPSVAALVLHGCVAPALCADRWVSGEARAAALAGQQVAAAAVTLRDDPTAPGAHGSYAFDDEGQAAAPVMLVDAGVLRGPLTDRRSARALGLARTGHGRRGQQAGPVTPAPSNLILAPGTEPPENLVRAVDRGLVLEGGLWARMDPGTWRFTVRAARARQIVRGKLTGVLHGDIDVHGEVPALLGAVQLISSAAERFSHGGGLAVATSASSPFLLTRGRVAGR